MIFRGSIPAVITPFTKNLDIDFDALGKHIDFLIKEGSHGLVSCGTTGESPTLSHDEHKKVTEFIIKKSNSIKKSRVWSLFFIKVNISFCCSSSKYLKIIAKSAG